MANRWILTKEGIRKGSKRYPKKKYSHITNERELEDFVIRLNGEDPNEERAKKSAIYKHAFISPILLDDYRALLNSRIPTKKDAKTKFTYLRKALDYFINELCLVNPSDWHKKQHLWGDDLLKTKYSSKVLREIVYELNRFIQYLHTQRPNEVIPLKFDPISKAALKLHEAKRTGRESLFIPDYHWVLIEAELKKTKIYSIAKIAYLYGLRRNEAMGLKLEDVRLDYLSLSRQYGGLPLKNRQKRKIPHWLSSPDQAYELIQQLPQLHPDTVTQVFTSIINKLGLPHYVFHDIRRTFITKCINLDIKPEDLRLAVGHSTIETTYRYYVMDSRNLNDKVYKPGA